MLRFSTFRRNEKPQFYVTFLDFSPTAPKILLLGFRLPESKKVICQVNPLFKFCVSTLPRRIVLVDLNIPRAYTQPMSRKKPTTPRSRIKNALRQLWLRSRERAAAIKREANTCERCHAKGSQAKGREIAIEVHHRTGIPNWDRIIDEVFAHLLVSPSGLEVICKDCHGKAHGRMAATIDTDDEIFT